jgi:hypothetical protein
MLWSAATLSLSPVASYSLLWSLALSGIGTSSLLASASALSPQSTILTAPAPLIRTLVVLLKKVRKLTCDSLEFVSGAWIRQDSDHSSRNSHNALSDVQFTQVVSRATTPNSELKLARMQPGNDYEE